MNKKEYFEKKLNEFQAEIKPYVNEDIFPSTESVGGSENILFFLLSFFQSNDKNDWKKSMIDLINLKQIQFTSEDDKQEVINRAIKFIEFVMYANDPVGVE